MLVARAVALGIVASLSIAAGSVSEHTPLWAASFVLIVSALGLDVFLPGCGATIAGSTSEWCAT